jgi:hypothetical protein
MVAAFAIEIASAKHPITPRGAKIAWRFLAFALGRHSLWTGGRRQYCDKPPDPVVLSDCNIPPPPAAYVNKRLRIATTAAQRIDADFPRQEA